MTEVETDELKKKNSKNGVFLRDDFILKLLRDDDTREYLINVIAAILKKHPDIIGKNFEIVNTKISPAKDVKNMEGDIVIKSNYAYFTLEINFNPLTKELDNKNISYVCSLLIKQLEKGKEKKYADIKKIIQLNVSRFDYFKKGNFIYTSSVMEEHLHMERSNLIKIIDINMEYLKKMNYNDIKQLDINTPEKLLYILTCEDREIWKKIYGDDELMKKIEDKINELDVVIDAYLDYDREKFMERTKREGYDQLFREEAREEGFVKGHAEGRAEGRAEGLAEGRLEIINTLSNSDIDFDKIIKILNLTDEEINKLNSVKEDI